MNVISLIAAILVIIGGLAWGLVGLVDFNLVTALFGYANWLVRTIYILVGLSALWLIFDGFFRTRYFIEK